MEAEYHKRLRELFEKASDLPSSEQEVFLLEATGRDPKMFADLKKLLGHDGEPTGALDRPVVAELGSALEAAIQTAEAEDSLPLPEAIGPYRILGLLGRGGMGVVYEAEQDSPARRVALKVMRPDVVTASMLKRFEHETQVLARLNHPGIAQIYDAGTAKTKFGPQPFLAMELVRGATATSYAEKRRLSLEARLRLLASIADAVHHAHQRGVVHRDLKPANVLVDGEGQVKVLDFGVATTLDVESHVSSMHTSVGEVVGTLSYMSPEQVTGRSKDVDARSDVYALGILAHELLTGAPPFDLRGKLIHEAARIVVEDEPSTLSAHDADFKGDVEWIVGKALEKNPERRYASADALASDVRRHLAHEPISARAPSVWYQSVKFTRRNRALVGGLMATLLALLIGLVVSTKLYFDSARRGVELTAALASEKEATKESETVTSFLMTMLQAASPEVEDRDLTVRELLERLAPDIDKKFADSPRQASGLHDTVARAFEQLGARELMVHHARRAFELRRDDPNAKLKQRQISGLLLGNVLSSAGEMDEAEEILNAELARAGEEAVLRVSLLTQLAKNDKNQGELRAAEARLDEAFALMESAEVPRKVRSGAQNVLAIVLARTGRLNEALELFQEVLALRIEVEGEDHPLVLEARHNLATILSMMGRNEEVLALDKEILATRLRVLRPDHPSTLNTKYSIGVGLSQLGRFAEAEPYLRESTAGRVAAMGPEHAESLSSRGGLARCLDGLGQHEEALEIYLSAIEDAAAGIGESHWVSILLTDNCGATLRALGRFDEAIDHHKRAASAAAEALGEGNAMTITALSQLATTCYAAERYAEAIEAGEKVLELAASHELSSPANVPETRELLMQIYLAGSTDEFHDLDRVFELGAEIEKDPRATAASYATYAHAHIKREEYATALRLLDRSLEMYAPDHPDVPGLKASREKLLKYAK